jgi:hypothetical protein
MAFIDVEVSRRFRESTLGYRQMDRTGSLGSTRLDHVFCCCCLLLLPRYWQLDTNVSSNILYIVLGQYDGRPSGRMLVSECEIMHTAGISLNSSSTMWP